MSKPFDIELFLSGVLTGSHATRKRHLRQAKIIHIAIAQRWQQSNPWTWKRKHLLWFMNHQSKNLANTTRYRYGLTIKLIVLRLGKSWELASNLHSKAASTAVPEGCGDERIIKPRAPSLQLSESSGVLPLLDTQ